jgi:hypothetical protein
VLGRRGGRHRRRQFRRPGRRVPGPAGGPCAHIGAGRGARRHHVRLSDRADQRVAQDYHPRSQRSHRPRRRPVPRTRDVDQPRERRKRDAPDLKHVRDDRSGAEHRLAERVHPARPRRLRGDGSGREGDGAFLSLRHREARHLRRRRRPRRIDQAGSIGRGRGVSAIHQYLADVRTRL